MLTIRSLNLLTQYGCGGRFELGNFLPDMIPAAIAQRGIG